MATPPSDASLARQSLPRATRKARMITVTLPAASRRSRISRCGGVVISSPNTSNSSFARQYEPDKWAGCNELVDEHRRPIHPSSVSSAQEAEDRCYRSRLIKHGSDFGETAARRSFFCECPLLAQSGQSHLADIEEGQTPGHCLTFCMASDGTPGNNAHCNAADWSYVLIE